MMTNTKLLEKITAQAENNNEVLREQLKEQILVGTKENSTSLMKEFCERYDRDFTSLSEQIKTLQETNFLKMCQLQDETKKQVMVFVESSQQKTLTAMNELSEKMDTQFSELLQISECISDTINNLQKDTAVMMETLQLILTNMLIDKVENKVENK